MALVRYTEEENKYLEKLIAAKGEADSANDIAEKFVAKYPERTVAAVQQRIFKTLKPRKAAKVVQAKAAPQTKHYRKPRAKVLESIKPAPAAVAVAATLELTLPSGAKLSGAPKQIAEVLRELG